MIDQPGPLDGGEVGGSPDSGSPTPKESALGRWCRRLALALSAVLCCALSVCYATRVDWCAAVTVFPVWTWLLPGLALGGLALRRRHVRPSILIAGGWLAFVLTFAEEPWSLLRLAKRPRAESRAGHGKTLRVVSLNCDIGNRRAAEEVVPYRPDIVCFQESPGPNELKAVAGVLFGTPAGVISGPDAALIVARPAESAALSSDERSFFVQGRVRLATGAEVEVISTRLVPALFRVDLWSLACWREQAANRRLRRKQMQAIARRIRSVPADIPVIVVGDFNAPQGDAVFRVLEPRLRDAFREGGRGWGNTVTNDFPFLRIDQVWVSAHFDVVGVTARKTKNSDHRLVICDLSLLDPE